MRKSIESGKHTQIKLLFIFYEVVHYKGHLGILVFNIYRAGITHRVIRLYSIFV